MLPTLTPFPFTPSMNENTRTKDFALVNCIFSGLPAPFPPQEQCLVFDEKSFILQDDLQDSQMNQSWGSFLAVRFTSVVHFTTHQVQVALDAVKQVSDRNGPKSSRQSLSYGFVIHS